MSAPVIVPASSESDYLRVRRGVVEEILAGMEPNSDAGTLVQRILDNEGEAPGFSERNPIPGFTYEYREGDDGGGSVWVDESGKQQSSGWPSSKWRRLVGPWMRIS